MPNDTSFAVMYKKLVDRGFEPDPERLARIRRDLIGQLASHSPPAPATRLWTNHSAYDTIHSETETGEEKK